MCFRIGLLIGLFCAFLQPVAWAEEPLPFEFTRGQVEFDVTRDSMVAVRTEDEQATLIRGDLAVTADVIEYDSQRDILSATGAIKLWLEGRILRGERMLLSLGSNEGVLEEVQEAELSDGVFFTGERLEYRPRNAGQAETDDGQPVVREYILYNGTVTGNDLPIPHYYTRFDRLVVVPDQRYWVYDMTFVMQSLPVFYFPFYSKSLQENQLAYYIYAGHYSRHGFAVFNKINYVPNDQLMVDLYGDYYTESGFGKGLKFTWDIEGEYGPEGELYGYHIKQEAPDNDSIFDGDDRFNISGRYAQNLPYDTRLTIQGHKFSDSEYVDDYDAPERIHDVNTRLIEQEPLSFFNLAKRFPDQSLRITGSTRIDEFYYNGLPYIERKPQVHFEQYPMRLFGSGVYGEMQLDYGRYNREQGFTYPVDDQTLSSETERVDQYDRFDGHGRLSYPLNLPERLTLEPWLGFRATQYEDALQMSAVPNALGGSDLQRFDFGSETRLMGEAGFNLSTRRTMEFEPFLDRYSRMRMVMEPVLEYGYFHPDTDLAELTAPNGGRFPYVDPADNYRAELHSFTTMLRTRVQGKDAAGMTNEFLRFGAGVGYELYPDENLRFDNFAFFDDPANQNDYRFTDLLQEFSIHPARWISLGNTLRYDVDDGEIRSSYYYANLQPIQPVSVTLGYNTFRFPVLNQNQGEQQEAVSQVRWTVSPKWQVYYGLRFDTDEGVFRRNNIGLVRDMYDFVGIFEIEHETHPTLGDDYSFSFGIELKGGQPPLQQEQMLSF